VTRLAACLALALALAACEAEVVIENGLEAPVEIRELSFNGCLWPVLLAPGERTSPCSCPPGADRVHFKRFDAQAFVSGVLEEVARGSRAYPPSGDRLGVKLPAPLWFAYRTREPVELEPGALQVLRVTPGQIEQDFEVPGPYGH